MFLSRVRRFEPLPLGPAGLALQPVHGGSALFLPAARPRGRESSLWQDAAKRCLDILVAGLALTVAALPMLLIGLLIRLDSEGPGLFRQCRIGRNGVAFTLLKFRTMHDHAAEESGELRQATRDDPRVTQ